MKEKRIRSSRERRRSLFWARRSEAFEEMDDIQFDEMRFDRPQNWRALKKGEWKAKQSINIAGQGYELAGTQDRWSSDQATIDEYEFIVQHADDKTVMSAAAVLFQAFDGAEGQVETKIERFDRHDKQKIMPKGSGLAMYEKLLLFIEVIPTDRPYTHFVKARPKGISMSEWEDRFVPLLEEWGYTQTQPGRWQKTYQPSPIQPR